MMYCLWYRISCNLITLLLFHHYTNIPAVLPAIKHSPTMAVLPTFQTFYKIALLPAAEHSPVILIIDLIFTSIQLLTM